MTSTNKYSCVEIEAEHGEGFQEYVYEDNRIVPQGTPVGVEITQGGKTEFFIYDYILLSTEPMKL